METSVVTSKGQMVIPANIRRRHRIKQSTKVVVIDMSDGFMVKPLDKKYFDQFAGILPHKGRATKALLADRKKERARENSRS